MIDVYSWTTGNARKVYIMLEECGLPYRLHPVNINKGDQFKPEFLAISPNNKIPAIVDRDGPGGAPYSLFESGAILMYLADKTGRFLPADPAGRYATIQWLMWQMGDLGPMFGQAGHFMDKAGDPPNAAARAHFVDDAKRLMRVLDTRLARSPYVAGEAYTIADMAIWAWCDQIDKRGLEPDDYPHFRRWHAELAGRAAMKKAHAVCDDIRAGRMAAE